MDKEVVKELIQSELNTKNIVKELSLILEGKTRNTMLDEFEILRSKLGGKGASDNAADIILKTI